MSKIQSMVQNFVRDEEGATAVEYALMVALIAVVIIGAVGILGRTLNGTFESVNEQITTEVPDLEATE